MNMLNRFRQAWFSPRNENKNTEPQQSTPVTESGAVENSPPESSVPTNVIALPLPHRGESSAIPEGGTSLHQSRPVTRFKGILNTPELEAFFQENFFGYGRHTGSKFRSHEMLEQGKQSIISQFKNKLIELIGRKQEKLNKLESELIAIQGVSNSMCSQLRLACHQLQRDIDLLQEQIDAASSGKGWILEPLQRYQIGFTKGLHEAIEFEILAG